MLRYVIKARLIDGTERPPLADAVLAIENGIITRVGTEADFGTSLKRDGATTLNANGMSVLPGLINAHEHITWRRSKGSFQERVVKAPPELLIAKGAGNCLV